MDQQAEGVFRNGFAKFLQVRVPKLYQVKAGFTLEMCILDLDRAEAGDAIQPVNPLQLCDQVPLSSFCDQAVGFQQPFSHFPVKIFVRCLDPVIFEHRLLEITPEWQGNIRLPPPGRIKINPLPHLLSNRLLFGGESCREFVPQVFGCFPQADVIHQLHVFGDKQHPNFCLIQTGQVCAVVFVQSNAAPMPAVRVDWDPGIRQRIDIAQNGPPGNAQFLGQRLRG